LGKIQSALTVILAKVTGDISIFDRPGPIAIRIERATQ
jgi:hypothetical protein